MIQIIKTQFFGDNKTQLSSSMQNMKQNDFLLFGLDECPSTGIASVVAL